MPCLVVSSQCTHAKHQSVYKMPQTVLAQPFICILHSCECSVPSAAPLTALCKCRCTAVPLLALPIYSTRARLTSVSTGQVGVFVASFHALLMFQLYGTHSAVLPLERGCCGYPQVGLLWPLSFIFAFIFCWYHGALHDLTVCFCLLAD